MTSERQNLRLWTALRPRDDASRKGTRSQDNKPPTVLEEAGKNHDACHNVSIC